ncbi:MAG: hypothetical protein J6Z18_06390 [Prevotella sp.]|nr:hypothetical protein [Prevotella sp.]
MRKLLFLLVFLTAITAKMMAQTDNERDHVVVTLNDGSEIEGFVTRYWTENGLFGSVNRDFKMRPVNTAEERHYTAEQVQKIRFIHPIYGDNKENVISALVAHPTTFKPRRQIRQFVHLEDATSRGTIYWWNGIDSQRMQLGTATLTTIYGVRLGDDDIVVPFMTGSVVTLNVLRTLYKKKDKQLVDYLDQRILSGGKRLWDSMAQHPGMFLQFIDDYYSNNK